MNSEEMREHQQYIANFVRDLQKKTSLNELNTTGQRWSPDGDSSKNRVNRVSMDNPTPLESSIEPHERHLGGKHFAEPTTDLTAVQKHQAHLVDPDAIKQINFGATADDHHSMFNPEGGAKLLKWHTLGNHPNFGLKTSTGLWTNHTHSLVQDNSNEVSQIERTWGTPKPKKTIFANGTHHQTGEFSDAHYKPIENNWRTMERAFPHDSDTPAQNLWQSQYKIVSQPDIPTHVLVNHVLSNGRHVHPHVAVAAINQLIKRKHVLKDMDIPNKVNSFFSEHHELSDRHQHQFGGPGINRQVVEEYGTHPTVEAAIDRLHHAFGVERPISPKPSTGEID